jgi:hypothetical protein
MKRIIALSVLFLIPVAAFAQNFDTEKYKSAIERKAYTAAQDNTRVVSNVKSIDLENYNERQKMFEAAGTDLTKYETAARHANIHLNVIRGTYKFENKADAIAALGLLATGDSPLVGKAQPINAILTSLQNYYVRNVAKTDKTSIAERYKIMIAVGLIANANYNVPMQGSTVGQLALKSLYQVIVNEDENKDVKRAAIISLGSIEKPAAVDKITQCISAINNGIGFFASKTLSPDGAFDFGKDGVLSVKDKDNDRALITALVLALESQSESKNADVKSRALAKLKWYAGLSWDTRYYHQMGGYEEKGGNRVAYYASLYILGKQSGRYSGSQYLTSKIVSEDRGGRKFLIEKGNAQKLIPVIESDDFDCYTRTAFRDVYEKILGERIYATGSFQPYSFDNCLKQKTDAVMLEITFALIGGGVDYAIGKVVVRSAAKRLALQALGAAAIGAANDAVHGGDLASVGKSGAKGAIATYAIEILGRVTHLPPSQIGAIWNYGNAAYSSIGHVNK